MKCALAVMAALIVALPAFAPASSQTGVTPGTPLQYKLLPGDMLDIHYRYTPIFDQTVTVTPDGYISLNLVGSLYVGSESVDQIHDEIRAKVAERLNDPEITVVIKESHQPYVVVAGEVAKPGKFELHDGSTAIRALMLAGGFGENARAGEVLVFRKVNDTMAEVHVLRLGRLDRNSDMANDLVLQSGDTIMVPRDRIFKLSRYIKLANIGFYINPLSNIP